MYNQRNMQQLLVCGTTTATAGTHTTYADFVANGATGEAKVFNAAIGSDYGAEVAAAATSAPFFVALKTADGVIKSDVIDPTLASTSFTYRAGVAEAQQVDFIGYNGTDQSIDSSLTDNLYFVELYLEELITSNGDGMRIKHFQHLSSSAGDSQAEIAVQLAGSLQDNMSKEKDEWVKAEAVLNTAASATNDFTNAVTLTKGSNQFTVATALTYNGTSGTLAVGDFIRIAPTAAATDLATDNATTRAYAVYKVTAIDSLTVTVDRKIDNISASVSYADSDDAMQVIPAATAATADAGVKLTAQDAAHTAGKLHSKPIRFTTNLQRFGTTIVTNSTAPTAGTGTGNEIAQMEWFYQGNEGEIYRMGEPSIHPMRSLVDTSELYDVVQIMFSNDEVSGFQGNSSPKTLTIAAPQTATADTNNYWAAANGLNIVLGDMLNGGTDIDS